MYTNYNGINMSNIPTNGSYRMANSIPSTIGYNSSNMPSTPYQNTSNDRFIGGGFLGPFILGGITGGLLAPAFYGPNYGRPTYYNNYYYPYPVCYGPYC